eukprot:3557448-Rhodomonas_salina.4
MPALSWSNAMKRRSIAAKPSERRDSSVPSLGLAMKIWGACMVRMSWRRVGSSCHRRGKEKDKSDCGSKAYPYRLNLVLRSVQMDYSTSSSNSDTDIDKFQLSQSVTVTVTVSAHPCIIVLDAY